MTGAFVLRELLVSGREPSEISRTLRERFGDASQDWDGDVSRAISQLEEEGLIVQASIESAVPAIEGEDGVGLPELYDIPALERHGELEQLILSGE